MDHGLVDFQLNRAGTCNCLVLLTLVFGFDYDGFDSHQYDCNKKIVRLYVGDTILRLYY